MGLLLPFLVVLCEALATASASTVPRIASKHGSHFLSQIQFRIDRSGTVGGGTIYGADFLGTNDANRQDFVGDNSASQALTTSIAHAAFSNYNWLVRAELAKVTGTVAVTAGSKTVTGSGTAFTTELAVGDQVQINGETKVVTAIASTTSLTVDDAFAAAASGVSCFEKDAVLRNTTDFAITNVGGFAVITMVAARLIPTGARVEVHKVTPVAIYTWADASVSEGAGKPVANAKGYDALWFVADATATPSATSITVTPNTFRN
jgi:hypothetical protein